MEFKRNIKILKLSYILEIIILIIIIVLNDIYNKKIDWMKEITTIFFYICFYCLIILTIFALVFLIIIYFKKSYHILFQLLKITVSLFVVRLIISFGLLVIYILNINVSKAFFEYCPFNFKKSDLSLLFPNLVNNNSNIDEDEIKNKCISRRCLELSNDNIEYNYICNFDSAKDFSKKSKITCEKYFSNFSENIEEIIISYINLCNPYSEIYKCSLYNTPEKYSTDINYICPNEMKKSFILEIILSMLNISSPFLNLVVQFTYFKKILKIIVTQEIQRHNDTKVNNTIDTSDKLNIKNSKSFKKEKTEIIVVDNNINNDDNIIQVLQKCKEITRKKKVKIFKNDLFFKKRNKKFCKNEQKIKIIKEDKCNKSFNIINKDNEFNINDSDKENKSESKTNSIRLLTDINNSKNSEKEKQEEDKVKYIVIKK